MKPEHEGTTVEMLLHSMRVIFHPTFKLEN